MGVPVVVMEVGLVVPSLPADVGGFSPVEGCAVYLRERFELERVVLGERGRRASLPAPRMDVAGRGCEGVPVVFLDFDGVLNALPGIDGEPADAGDMSRVFALDGVAVVPGPDGVRIRWSRELAAGLYGLAAAGKIDLRWLSTWQPHTGMLDTCLGWDPPVARTVVWYGQHGVGLVSGKFRTVAGEVLTQRRNAARGCMASPIVWIDDDETGGEAAHALHGSVLASPMLLVQPDPHTGISRPQWACIRRFVSDPPVAVGLYRSDPWNEDGYLVGDNGTPAGPMPSGDGRAGTATTKERERK